MGTNVSSGKFSIRAVRPGYAENLLLNSAFNGTEHWKLYANDAVGVVGDGLDGKNSVAVWRSFNGEAGPIELLSQMLDKDGVVRLRPNTNYTLSFYARSMNNNGNPSLMTGFLAHDEEGEIVANSIEADKMVWNRYDSTSETALSTASNPFSIVTYTTNPEWHRYYVKFRTGANMASAVSLKLYFSWSRVDGTYNQVYVCMPMLTEGSDVPAWSMNEEDKVARTVSYSITPGSATVVCDAVGRAKSAQVVRVEPVLRVGDVRKRFGDGSLVLKSASPLLCHGKGIEVVRVGEILEWRVAAGDDFADDRSQYLSVVVTCDGEDYSAQLQVTTTEDGRTETTITREPSYNLSVTPSQVGVFRLNGINNYIGGSVLTVSVVKLAETTSSLTYAQLNTEKLKLWYQVDGGTPVAMTSLSLNLGSLATYPESSVDILLKTLTGNTVVRSATVAINQNNRVPNPNLLRGARLSANDIQYWTDRSSADGYVSVPGKDGIGYSASVSTTAYSWLGQGLQDGIKHDTLYTMSFWVKATKRVSTANMNVLLFQYQEGSLAWLTSSRVDVTETDGNWHFMVVKMRTQRAGDLNLRFRMDAGLDVEITQPKLEEGDAFTGWQDNESDKQGYPGCQSRVWMNGLSAGQEYRNDSLVQEAREAYYNDFLLVVDPEAVANGVPTDGNPGGYICFRCIHTYTQATNVDLTTGYSTFSSLRNAVEAMRSVENGVSYPVWEWVGGGGAQFFSTIIAQSANIRMLSGSCFVVTDNANVIKAGMGNMGDHYIWAGGRNAEEANYAVYKNGVVKASLFYPCTKILNLDKMTDAERTQYAGRFEGSGRSSWFRLDPVLDGTTTLVSGNFILPLSSTCAGLTYRIICALGSSGTLRVQKTGPSDTDWDFIFGDTGGATKELPLGTFSYLSLISVGAGWAIESATEMKAYGGTVQAGVTNPSPGGFITTLNPGISAGG